MLCPNCNTSLTNEKICPNCKINISAAKKIMGMSNRLYNKGLEQVKLGDLTGAVDTLKRSIYFNKNNYNARNLLGLVFYHTGLIGDAFIQWVISSNVEKTDNLAITYLKDSNKNQKTLEKYDSAVKMYNRSVRFLKQNNEDMAIMELKKAISTSSNFLQAKNLLAFCYILKGNNNKALSLVNDVLKVDVKNPIALNYYNEIVYDGNRLDLSGVENAPKTFKKETNKSPIRKNTKKKTYSSTYTGINKLGFFLGGILICLAIMCFLVVPEINQTKNDKIIELERDVELLKESYEGLQKKSTDSLNLLEIENNDLKKRLGITTETTTETTTEITDIEATEGALEE